MPIKQRLCSARMSIELRHLRAFVAIGEHGTITAAASVLHTGQPTLSRTLRQLETRLGVRLVDRSTHHLELTAAGRALLGRAKRVLADVEALLDPARLGNWPLRLGHAWSAMGEQTAALLRRWRLAHPEVPLELVRIDERGAGLAEGKVDVAVLRGRVAVPGAQVEWLRDERRVAAVPAGGPLAERTELTLAELSGHTVAVNPVSGTTTARLWPAAIRPATIEVHDTEEWLVAVASGRAVGVSAEATGEVHPFPGVVYFPLRDAPPLPVSLVWHDPPTHPRVADLVALAHELVGNSSTRLDGMRESS
jgi:DNA-binding transcriptional LysR family regulator